MVLSDSDVDPENADATTLMVLMYLWDIAKKAKQNTIPSEMQDVRNHKNWLV